MLYLLGVLILKPIMLLYGRPKVQNRAALKSKGKVIYVSNHVKMSDPLWIVCVTTRFIHFMAKSTLFSSKLMRAIFRMLLCFPVNQRTADTKAIKQAVELLNKGKAFGIFPEGRRAVADEMDDFEKGTALIAARTEAPIVPIYISPTTYTGSHRLRMIVGEKIYAKDVKAKAGNRRIVDALTERMQSDMEELKERMEEIVALKKAKA